MGTSKIAILDLNAHFGGGQVALCNMAHALSTDGNEVNVILGLNYVPDRIRTLRSNNCNFHLTLGYDGIYDVPVIKHKISRYIEEFYKKHKFDVIITQGLNGIFVPKFLRERSIVTIHGNNIRRGLSLLQFLYHRTDMIPYVKPYYNNYIKNIAGHFLYACLERIACQNSKIVVTLTQTEKYYAKKYYFLTDEKIRIVPNVICSPYDHDPKKIVLPENRKIILSVGSLEFVKGIPIITKAMEHVLGSTEDVLYIYVGDGLLMPILRKLAIKYPKKVIVFPHISEGLFSLYHRSMIFLHGSIFEAFGLSIGEAMLAEKPVVAFNVASIPHLVIDHVTGLLAKPMSPEDLASKTLQLLENEEKARRMGTNGRKMIEKNYNPHIVASKMERVLGEV